MSPPIQSPKPPPNTIPLDRRRFVVDSTAGLLATSLLLREPSSLAARADRLRIGAIGVGNRGLDNLSAVADQHIIALCDVDDRFLGPAQERFPEAKSFHDYREMFDRCQLDAVLVSTPNHSHFHAVWLALKRGLHVYCEKPLAHSVDQLRLLVREASRRGVVTQTGNQHHNSDGYRKFANWVRSGRVGNVREAHVWTNRPYWEQGIARPTDSMEIPQSLHWDLWIGPAPYRPFHSVYHPLGWRGWWDFGGGALADMGPHLLDPIFSALDLKQVLNVQATFAGGTTESPPNASVVSFTIARGAGVEPLRLTWYDGDKRPHQDITKSKQPPPNGILLLTDEGRLFAPQLGGAPIFVSSSGRAIAEPSLPERDPIDHHQEWVRACLQSTPASCPFSSAHRLTETCLLGNVAIRSQTTERLEWDDQLATFPKHPRLNEYLKLNYRAGWEVT